jgi:RNA polymerase sigma factor (sigma-70 family)
VGLNPDTAAYTKSKPRVRAYMLEHRARMQQQLVEQETEGLAPAEPGPRASPGPPLGNRQHEPRNDPRQHYRPGQGSLHDRSHRRPDPGPSCRLRGEETRQIFRKLPFLREPAVFRPWAFRIASRIAFSHLKHAHRWQPLDDAPPEHLATPNPNFGEPPDAAFFTLLEHVSPASRAVLLLHYQHDLSLEESAAILEIPIGTVKSRLHYGVTTLRKHLTSERKPT